MSTVKEFFDRTRQQTSVRPRRDPDVPLNASERNDVADDMSRRACERGQRIGHQDHWCRYFEAIAEIYSENARRGVRNEALLPLPRILSIMERMQQPPPPRVVNTTPPSSPAPSGEEDVVPWDDEEIPF